MKLPKDFYLQEDVVKVSRSLLGKVLCTKFNGALTSGIITETEAYAGVNDRASHAYGGRRTKRTGVMYAEGGKAYVYFCYGMHHLFNVVSGKVDIPHAVLIRAVIPVDGMDLIVRRRKIKSIPIHKIARGPGTVAQALGIQTMHSGFSLLENKIWIEDRNILVKDPEISSGPRVGIAYAKEDALLPYRFVYTMT